MKLPVVKLQALGGIDVFRLHAIIEFDKSQRVIQRPLGGPAFQIQGSGFIFDTDRAGIAAIGQLDVAGPLRMNCPWRR